MALCGHCRENVTPKMYLTWKGFIQGLGVFYLIYIITKVPHCPNCSFPMPRRSMVFAFHPQQQLIKLARICILQLSHFKDGAISASRRYNINRKFYPSQNFGSMNPYQTTSFNKRVNEGYSSIGLRSYRFK
jgi:hypothetical protein